jgi:hypothetical protein
VHLQRFVASTNAADLDQAGFDRWCASFANLSSTTRRGRQLAVRKLCLFRQRTEQDCFVPDPLYFARLCPYRRPVIIEPSQAEQMLTVADSLVPTATRRCCLEPCTWPSSFSTPPGCVAASWPGWPSQTLSLRFGFCAFGRRSSTNPGWCRYRRPQTTRCVPICGHA